MKPAIQTLLILVLVSLPLFVADAAFAQPRDEAIETARLLATLLDVGRTVVDRNEGLIDDPHKGEKGFTPEVFERQVAEEFEKRAGVSLLRLPHANVPALARELLPMLLTASKDVVAEAQIVINQRGIGYKNFIPATFGSQAAARFSAGSHVKLKQTALQPRNPKNAPDPYEVMVLSRWMAQAKQRQGTPGAHIESTEDGTTLRVLTPLFYGKHCLACHGEPAGEIDVAGYPKEGAREGDLAGAISVFVPMKAR